VRVTGKSNGIAAKPVTLIITVIPAPHKAKAKRHTR
jgi:hypothetical protein